MCAGLWEKYPYDDESEALGGGLMQKHFPNVVARSGTGPRMWRIYDAATIDTGEGMIPIYNMGGQPDVDAARELVDLHNKAVTR